MNTILLQLQLRNQSGILYRLEESYRCRFCRRNSKSLLRSPRIS